MLKLIPLLFFVACKGSAPSNEQIVSSTTPVSVVERPAFSSDSAFLYVKQQCEFGSRVPNSDAHEKCASFLENKLKGLGLDVEIQKFESEAFDGKKLKGTNIIGFVHPEMEKRVALFSHWDSRPFCDNDVEENWRKSVMGANDGASGVAVLIEIARQLVLKGDSLGVDIVFLDLEDYGQPSFETKEKKDTWCLGSQYLSWNPYYKTKPKYGILLDMVGGENPYFGYDMISSRFAEDYLRKIWSIANSLGYSSSFVPKLSGSIIDDHYYINTVAAIPTVDIIDFEQNRGFPKTWHTTKDTPENIKKETLQMVGEVVLSFLRK